MFAPMPPGGGGVGIVPNEKPPPPPPAAAGPGPGPAEKLLLLIPLAAWWPSPGPDGGGRWCPPLEPVGFIFRLFYCLISSLGSLECYIRIQSYQYALGSLV